MTLKQTFPFFLLKTMLRLISRGGSLEVGFPRWSPAAIGWIDLEARQAGAWSICLALGSVWNTGNYQLASPMTTRVMTPPRPLSTSLSAPLHHIQACFSLLNKEEKFNSFLWFTWRVALVEIGLLATALEPKLTRTEASRSPAPTPGALRPVPRSPLITASSPWGWCDRWPPHSGWPGNVKL